MEETFSPKQVASAIGVSESSIKRWCDRGGISTTKTLGGHRRVTLDGLMAFLEATQRQIINPSSLGIRGLAMSGLNDPSDTPDVTDELAASRVRFEGALTRGDENECRKIVSHWYAECQSFAKVADHLIAPSFHRIGELWHDKLIEVFQERRACEICVRLIHEFRRLMVEPSLASPVAIGCATSGDHYMLPGQLIEVVLREVGWRATNLGSNIPLQSVAAAVHRERPKLVWLSVSFISDEAAFVDEFNAFWNAIPRDVSLVVGGRVMTDELRPKLHFTAHCDTMQQLSILAGTLKCGVSRDRAMAYLPMQKRLNSESSTSSV